jgi:mannose-6-phosphate isomerase-like protein (cupin superfamily)
MTELNALQLISTKTAEHYTWGSQCDGWFLLKGDAIHVIQERMPPHTAEVMHFHRKSTQLFYALRGELSMESKSASLTIPAGSAFIVGPNTEHRASNQTDQVVEFLVISCPPSHADRFDCES